MLIDWFTVVAQVVNFLILVWLLKRFLYRPILDAIDARELRIATALATADSRQAEASQERDTYQRKSAALEQERAAAIDESRVKAETLCKHMIDEARHDATALRARQMQNLAAEIRELHARIGLHTRQEVLAIARQALRDLAGVDLQERILATFIKRLRSLAPEQRQQLAALQASAVPLDLRSAIELTPAQRESLLVVLRELFGTEVSVRFEIDATALCGIELSGNGLSLGWNLAEYLGTLEKYIDALLNDLSLSQAATAEVDTDG